MYVCQQLPWCPHKVKTENTAQNMGRAGGKRKRLTFWALLYLFAKSEATASAGYLSCEQGETAALAFEKKRSLVNALELV